MWLSFVPILSYVKMHLFLFYMYEYLTCIMYVHGIYSQCCRDQRKSIGSSRIGLSYEYMFNSFIKFCVFTK